MVPPDFEFSIKAWQFISHPPASPTYRKAGIIIELEKRDRYGFLRPTDEVFRAWNKMKEIAEILKSKIIVIQMPPAFKCINENKENARAFFSSINRKGIDIAFEPRGDWLKKPEEIKKIVDELDLIHCVDIFWDQPQSTHPISYIRLHGLGKRYNYRYVYTEQDMHELAERVRELEKEGKEEIYILFNNIMMRDSALLFEKILMGGR
jgi:uncharacterized protein YecE (DUF72 family)